MHQQKIKRLCLAAVFCALTFSATWISVPAPAVGNVNLGDAVLLLGAQILGGPWSAVSAAVGAMLADLSSGYTVYAPATFLIKAAMVGVFLLLVRLLSRLPRRVACLLASVAAELTMIVGYFLYECLILGIALHMDGFGIVSLANIPFNAVQGAVAVLLSSALSALLARAGLISSHGKD